MHRWWNQAADIESKFDMQGLDFEQLGLNLEGVNAGVRNFLARAVDKANREYATRPLTSMVVGWHVRSVTGWLKAWPKRCHRRQTPVVRAVLVVCMYLLCWLCIISCALLRCRCGAQGNGRSMERPKEEATCES